MYTQQNCFVFIDNIPQMNIEEQWRHEKRGATMVTRGTTTGREKKMATVFECDPKAPFSIATTLILSLDCSSYPWSVRYNVGCKARKHQIAFFESLVGLDVEYTYIYIYSVVRAKF